MEIKIINLEHKLPTVDQALIRLDQALRDARSQKNNVIKVIHGYGSSGKGGAIKKALSTELATLQSQSKIKFFVKGEDFSPFSESARKLLQLIPEMRKDSDYSRDNHGITIIVVS